MRSFYCPIFIGISLTSCATICYEIAFLLLQFLYGICLSTYNLPYKLLITQNNFHYHIISLHHQSFSCITPLISRTPPLNTTVVFDKETYARKGWIASCNSFLKHA